MDGIPLLSRSPLPLTTWRLDILMAAIIQWADSNPTFRFAAAFLAIVLCWVVLGLVCLYRLAFRSSRHTSIIKRAPLTDFTLFPRLPVELQQYIFRLALITSGGHGSYTYLHTLRPILLPSLRPFKPKDDELIPIRNLATGRAFYIHLRNNFTPKGVGGRDRKRRIFPSFGHYISYEG